MQVDEEFLEPCIVRERTHALLTDCRRGKGGRRRRRATRRRFFLEASTTVAPETLSTMMIDDDGQTERNGNHDSSGTDGRIADGSTVADR